MKRLTLTAAAAFLALGVAAYAQTTPAPGAAPEAPRAEQRGERMERRAARMEERMNRRMEQLKTELKLSPQQEALWSPVQAQLRKVQEERRNAWRSQGERFRNAELPDRLELMADRAARGATSMRELSAVVKPLWATLSAEQKEIVRENLPGARWGQRG